MPPSIMKFTPLIQEASSDTKNETKEAISSGTPTLLVKCCLWSKLDKLDVLGGTYHLLVSIQPELIEITLILYLLKLTARACVSAIIPPLEAEYGSVLGSD